MLIWHAFSLRKFQILKMLNATIFITLSQKLEILIKQQGSGSCDLILISTYSNYSRQTDRGKNKGFDKLDKLGM